ncbi:triphosphoribosyl-dephospho-CoA synthase [Prosthecodimorpha staleyi]|uniref:Triphosphoribosyl-dephospho-CoA synthase n=1 Tax=Prosthecodimorpha staleyi TaxID=2840188 RepID=A0A947D6D3_9HYPH|nr:triphosphoribosyl-dephospho-CoA synthase [Prosthecodimorpha staleyi]MBT9291898.1 triphosphoribosyl-dephospho-CoA synthase [Prosthecodimorpha staleyi]
MTAGAPGPSALAAAFEQACLLELQALKPGNVHIHAPGHRMTVADFELSAAVAAPLVARPGARVGRRVREAVEATMAAVGQNTNLGILLLAAPILAAAERGGDLRADLGAILAELDRQDAEDVFAAIRRANPGGLGRVPEHDVTGPAGDLLVAMAAAADRDTIARQYATGFADLWTIGLPALAAAIRRSPFGPDAVTDVYLAWLAARPDSHILRKFGVEIAEDVQRTAERLIGSTVRAGGPAALMEWDTAWKQRGINPGTSADLTVATILPHLIRRFP